MLYDPTSAKNSRLAITKVAAVSDAYSYTVMLEDTIVRMDCTTFSGTAVLPTAAAARGATYTLKVAAVGATKTATLKAAGAELIDGANTVVLSLAKAWVTVISDGVSWDIIAKG